MPRKKVSSVDLTYIFLEHLKTYTDCSPTISIAIVPTRSGWTAVTNGWSQFKNPNCGKCIQKVEQELRKTYDLAND